jgi:rhamnosyltransferase
MKILAHIHTLNDEEVIEQSLQALVDQTYPVQEILVVDNGSTDRTLEKLALTKVTVVCHSDNRGTSGAVVTGFQYALVKQYDWIWLFDADSAPRKDALEKLVELYISFPRMIQERVWMISSLPVDLGTQRHNHAVMFTSKGMRQIRPDPGQEYYKCDATIWSGSLYKLEVVQKIGLPCANYKLDWGEFAYGYLGKLHGYSAFMHQRSIVDHNIGGQPSLHYTSYCYGPVSWRLMELPPIRCYYVVRNALYFWLFEYHVRNVYTLCYCFHKVIKVTASFLLRPSTHWAQLIACLRGIRDGLNKNLLPRY